MPLSPSLNLTNFCFYSEGTESGSIAIAAQNTNITRDKGTGGVQTCHIRTMVQEQAGNAGAATDDYQIQYSKNGGGYSDVTTSSSNVKAYSTGNLTDGGATTNRLTGGTGSFVAGLVSLDGLADNLQITASNFTEFVYTLQIVPGDLNSGDTLDFRVLRNGGVFTYTFTPRITINNSDIVAGRRIKGGLGLNF